MINDKLRTQKNGSGQMSPEQLENFLSTAQYGTLTYTTNEGWPDARVLNFGYLDGKLYFHIAKNHGEKLQHLKDGCKVCVSFYSPSPMVGKMRLCCHESALVYGTLTRLENKEETFEEAKEGLKRVCIQGGTAWKIDEHPLEMSLKGIGLYRIDIEHKVGKYTVWRSLPENSYIENVLTGNNE